MFLVALRAMPLPVSAFGQVKKSWLLQVSSQGAEVGHCALIWKQQQSLVAAVCHCGEK